MRSTNPSKWAPLLLPLLYCLTALAEPRIVVPKDPSGDEVRQTAVDFWSKFADHDWKGAKALFAGPPDQVELLNAHISFHTAAQQLHEAFVARFKNADADPAGFMAKVFADRAEYTRRQPLVLNGDAASVARGSQLVTGMELRRISGNWRVTHLLVQHQRTDAMRQFLTESARTFDQLRAEIESGKLTNLEAARSAITNQMDGPLRAWLESNVPPASPTTVPTTHPKLVAAAAPPPTAAPSLEALQACAGKRFASPEVQRLIGQLPGLPYMGMYKESAEVTSPEAGISLRFPASDATLAVELYIAGDRGISPYRGALPRGLRSGDRRRDVERKIGRPPSSGGGGTVAYYASYSSLGISIGYVSSDARSADNPIEAISLLPLDPLAELPTTQPADADAAAAHRPPRIALRLVARSANPGEAAAEALPDPSDPNHAHTLLVLREALLDQRHIAEVSGTVMGPDDPRYAISLTFTTEGAQRLRTLSRYYVGSKLAIVLDGQVLMAPAIQGEISDRVVISFPDGTSRKEIAKLAGKLHSIIYALPPEPSPSTAPQR